MHKLWEQPVNHFGRRGFTLVEVLVAATITILLLWALVGVVGASLEAMGRATRSVQHHEALNQLLRSLRDDLRDLRVLGDSGVATFILRQSDEETILAVIRFDPRFHDFSRQGYYRQVEYRWSREDRCLIRAVWHAADEALAGELGGDLNSANHESNVSRLARLTPAFRRGQEGNWLESPEMARSRAAAAETSCFEGVEFFEVEAVNFREGGLAKKWQDADRLPSAVWVRLEAPSSFRGRTRRFEFLVPVQIELAVRK